MPLMNSFASIKRTVLVDDSAGSELFASTWKTDNTGTSNNDQITLPLTSAGTYDFRVRWGDGTSDQVTAYDQVLTGEATAVTHTYAAGAGTYTITIDGQCDGWSFENGADKLKILDISNWGSLGLGDVNQHFQGCTSLGVSATDAPTVGTTLQQAFQSCTSLTSIGNGWDVSSVTNISLMFAQSTFNDAEVSNWNTSSVTNMSNMFLLSTSFNQSINDWNVSNVTTFLSMFNGATSYDQDMNSWTLNTSGSAVSLEGMFQGATAFGTTGGNIVSWTTTEVTTMKKMFFGAVNFNKGIGTWNVAKVTTMESMFNGADAFNQDISSANWTTSALTNVISMFNSADSFSQDLGGWDISQLTHAAFMFNFGALTTAHYNALLLGWGGQTPSVQDSVSFSAGSTTYTEDGDVIEAARLVLTSTHSWTIVDGN